MQEIPVQLAVVEWRRTSLPFFDYRGRIAARLAGEFGDVSFNLPIVAGETPIFAEGIQITVPGTQRQGVVDGRQIRFQEDHPGDIAQFSADASRFIRVADGLTAPATYDRLGILFVFISGSVPDGDMDVDEDLPDGWSLDNIAVRATKTVEGWSVIGTVLTQFEREGPTVRRLLREVSIDQFKIEISSEEGQEVDIEAAHVRAQSLWSEIARRGT